MGEAVSEERLAAGDPERFAERCRAGLEALEALLARPGFGAGPPSVGLELEIGLVDGACEPAPVNEAVCAGMADPRVELELDRFNLELASRPVPLARRPFSALRADLEALLAAVARAAAPHGARPAVIGILPTLRTEHLGAGAMSDSPRYRALNDGLRSLRDGPFQIRIEGDESLALDWDDVTLEGAATGLHVHLRAPPAEFPAVMNAAQMATAPALAAAVNSPLLLGRRLWDETRVALFGQAIDDRAVIGRSWLPSRASFGHGWVASAAEPFAESVALHVPILPVVGDEDPVAAARSGAVPRLDELRLHHGTVWRWNRAVVHTGEDPHLRVEMRALPAGPTSLDMAANAALLVGLTLALAPQAGWATRSLPFELARRNFYAAARAGLDALLLWPSPRAPSPRPRAAADLVLELIPAARDALVAAGVDAPEAEGLLEVVAERVRRGLTGAEWQRRALTALELGAPRPAALAELTERYLAAAAGGAPAHLWPIP